MSFNMDAAGFYYDSGGDVLDLLILFAKYNPDIITLQEYYVDFCKPLHEELLKKYPFYCCKKEECATVIYSKFPILNFFDLGDVIDSLDVKNNNERSEYKSNLKSSYSDVLFADIKIDTTLIHIVSCHLSSNGYSSISKESNMPTIDRLQQYYNSFKAATRDRRYETDAILRLLKEYNYKRSIVCGDLNSTPESNNLRRLQDGENFSDIWWQCGNGFCFTYFNDLFVFRLDHIFCTKDIKSQSISSLKNDYSDHAAIIFKFDM